MSMLGTLGKIAMGIAVAKGAGNLLGKNNQSGQSGGLGDLLGGLLGGKNNSTGTSSTTGGGLGDLLGTLIGGVTGNTTDTTTSKQTTGGGLADILSAAFSEHNDDKGSEDDKAKLLLKAMINAAKSDGKVDEEEQAKITKYLDDITPEEVEFVTNELTTPLDIDAFIAEVPSNMANEVYLMSLLTINLDNKKEKNYLKTLAKGLDISEDTVNKIHSKLNVAPLY
ncbi:MAG: hypothetical protein DSZ08_08635 [Sulfurovum sp.]|nr:MAG: hypothetical protein DSZ08_08635 [Sulfurovum sp.]